MSEWNNETVSVLDAFSNPLFRLGYGSQSPLEATEYPMTRMTDNYALLNSLYRDNWVVQNVVGIIPDDITRKWFTLTGTISPKHIQELEQVQTNTALRESVNEGLRWGRLYGGAAGLIMIRGQEHLLDRPLDLGAILPGTFQGLYVLDRWCGIAPELGLIYDGRGRMVPEYYTISGENGRTVARVHHSRIIRFTGRELPYLERIAELYWGESEVEALYQDVVKHDNVAANMAALTFRANVDTMEVQNLDQLFAMTSGEAQRRFWNLMQAQSVIRSNFGMHLVNKGDQVKNTQYTFTGLEEVYEAMCLDLSGASRIPMTKLFGRSPAGLNATGESDLTNYYDYIDSLRESKLRPILQKLLPVLAMSAWGCVPEGMDITFPPLWAPKADEVAKIASAKAETILAVFQSGLLGADTAQKELKKLAAETGMFDSITDEEIAANRGRTYAELTALSDPFAGLTPPAASDEFTRDSLTADYNPHHDPATGRFTSGGGGSKIGSGKAGKTKYAPSPQRSHKGIQLKPKKYARLCGTLNTQFPGLKAGDVRCICDAKKVYTVEADGYGGMHVISAVNIK